jgi:hypothetical protein
VHPVLLVAAESWEAFFACDLGDKIVSLPFLSPLCTFHLAPLPLANHPSFYLLQDIVGPLKIGTTASLDEAYKLLTAVRALAEWVSDQFMEWVEGVVGLVERLT